MIVAALLCAQACAQAAFASEPIRDPIPTPIVKGDIVVEVVDFVRVPKTEDSSGTSTNQAYARIQYMVPFPGGLLINDLRGPLYVTDMSGSAPRLFLDLRKMNVGFDDSMFPNETGVSGVAFHPDYNTPGKPGFGKLYTAYSASSESGEATYLDDDSASHESVIREWTTPTPAAVPFTGTSREVFRVGQFAPNHNVGTLAFNPTARPDSEDYGLLYASFGDGGAANDPRQYGQSIANPNGTIIRIDPLEGDGGKPYQVPADNPFVGRADAAPEIWAYGLRHAQHFSWDNAGRLFATDIGQNQIEEVNLIVPGGNYGWRLREGTFATAFDVEGGEPGLVYARPEDTQRFVYPVAQYDHDEGAAIGSGFAYQGSAIAALRGKYVFADLVRGRIFYVATEGLEPGRPAIVRELRLRFDGAERDLSEVSSFANSYAPGGRVDLRLSTDVDGELYLLTKGDGWIRKIVPARN